MPFGFANYVFYALGAGKVFLIEYDTFQVASGELRLQTGGASQPSSLAGSWGFEVSGAATGGAIDRAGQFVADAQGGLLGNEDQNAPSLSPFSQVVGAGSSYAVDATGHGSLTLGTPGGTSGLSFYFVSPSQILMLGTLDGQQILVGEANRQP